MRLWGQDSVWDPFWDEEFVPWKSQANWMGSTHPPQDICDLGEHLCAPEKILKVLSHRQLRSHIISFQFLSGTWMWSYFSLRFINFSTCMCVCLCQGLCACERRYLRASQVEADSCWSWSYRLMWTSQHWYWKQTMVLWKRIGIHNHLATCS